jgi:release factor glutamine methyltransferase
MGETSIAEALRTEGVDTTDARALLRAALGVTDAHLAAHPGQRLTDGERGRFVDWVRRRRAGEPVAYLTGEREFWSLTFKVTPAVLIPRPETETLVELALERIGAAAPASVLDLGTGCGCVAVAIAAERPGARVTATDASRDALEIARENARSHQAAIEFVESDWLAALAGRRFDLIVANPPYVAARDPHLARGDLRFEPRVALDGGADGLASIRTIVADSRAHLAPGGWLILEHGHDQGARCRALLQDAGYGAVFSRRDLAGKERASGGRFDAGHSQPLK